MSQEMYRPFRASDLSRRISQSPFSIHKVHNNKGEDNGGLPPDTVYEGRRPPPGWALPISLFFSGLGYVASWIIKVVWNKKFRGWVVELYVRLREGPGQQGSKEKRKVLLTFRKGLPRVRELDE